MVELCVENVGSRNIRIFMEEMGGTMGSRLLGDDEQFKGTQITIKTVD